MAFASGFKVGVLISGVVIRAKQAGAGKYSELHYLSLCQRLEALNWMHMCKLSGPS